ncbi:unnamed protein product [Didymodactylos carnosus]|uniref:G-protein coupled receptors family 1 profile domain-containing protein n=1 Tax=Didymodactylos carnosus TaxID=1234261 RepID=A0A813PP51_9BILA|nr:unnamed protein product [Didymodactylos carnosus]CAF3531281.1 unnamed protein product [Didymodactylos carnosus]
MNDLSPLPKSFLLDETYLTLTQSTLFTNLTTTINDSTLQTTKSPVSSSDEIYRYITEIIIYKYVCTAFFVIGMIGNGLSVIVFSRKVLRRRSCAIYFLALAVTDLLYLSFSLIDTVLPSYSLTITAKSLVICKLNTFMVYFTSDYSNYLLAVASIDRAVSIQCPLKAKLFCRAKVAIYIIIFLGLLLFLINVHLLFGFEIVHSSNGQSGCTATDKSFFDFSSLAPIFSEKNEEIATNINKTSIAIETTASLNITNASTTAISNTPLSPPFTYRRFYEIYDSLDILRAVVIPFSIMVVCNILIIIRVLESRRSITTIITSTLMNKNKFRKRHEKDRQLTIMLLGSALVLTLPTEINDTVRAFRSSPSTSLLNPQKGIEPLITAIFITLGQLNHAIHFYIYTLTGSVFRDELLKLIRCINCQLLGCRCHDEEHRHRSFLRLAPNNIEKKQSVTTVPANNNIHVNDELTQIDLFTKIGSSYENEI